MYPSARRAQKVAAQVFRDRDRVRVCDHDAPSPDTTDIVAMLEDFPPAYSVEISSLPDSFVVLRYGRYGLTHREDTVELPFPVPADSPDFVSEVQSLLEPIVAALVAKAECDERADYAKDGPLGIYEARNAVTPLRANPTTPPGESIEDFRLD